MFCIFGSCENCRSSVVRADCNRVCDALSRGDFFQRTALHSAAHEGHAEIVKILVLNGASIFQVDKYKETALHAACATGKVHVVRWLLLYVTERLRREVTDRGIQQLMRDSFDAVLKKRLTEYQTQVLFQFQFDFALLKRGALIDGCCVWTGISKRMAT